MSERLTGRVSRWLNTFGFINVDGQEHDLFVHFSEIEGC